MNRHTLTRINTSFESYQCIIDLYNQNKNLFYKTIEVSFEQSFSVNLCSAVGGILDKLVQNLNTISIKNISPNIHSNMQGNDFLSHFGYKKSSIKDNYSIKYLKIKPTDSRFFHRYIVKEFLKHPALSEMDFSLKKKIAESIYEIFVNARIHSESDFIYTCGYFSSDKKTLEFTITDIGIGFKNRINKRFETKLSSVQAIKWAIRDGHSTKQGISGGIGLAILTEFVSKNKGRIQIISDDGFYQLDSIYEETKFFDGPFPGTIINIMFKTDDISYLSLKNKELLFDDIF